MRKLFIMVLIVIFLPAILWAGNTETRGGNFISLILDGSTDWDTYSSANNNGLRIRRIEFYPSALNDKVIIRQDSVTGVIITQLHCPATPAQSKLREFNCEKPINVVIEASECVLGTPANALLMIELAE